MGRVAGGIVGGVGVVDPAEVVLSSVGAGVGSARAVGAVGGDGGVVAVDAVRRFGGLGAAGYGLRRTFVGDRYVGWVGGGRDGVGEVAGGAAVAYRCVGRPVLGVGVGLLAAGVGGVGGLDGASVGYQKAVGTARL